MSLNPHKETKNFLIRIPIELYEKLEESATLHHRSKTQEAIVALRNGLSTEIPPIKKPKPFGWKKKVSRDFVRKAVKESRE